MPFTQIDEEKLRDPQRTTLDVSAYPGSPTGIPIKEIPADQREFPRVVYLHPKDPTRTIIHRNTKHEIVDEEFVMTEHEALKVNDKKELKTALENGYQLVPYIPHFPATN